MSPFIRGFQDNVSNWVSSLIHQQDGRLQTVAQQATQGPNRQEQLAQKGAHSAAMPSQHNQAQYLRAPLAHREAQLERVRSERDTHFVAERALLAHMRLLSREAKDWKSRVVSEAEQVFAENPQKLHNVPLKRKKPWINSFKLDGDKLKQNSETCVGPNT